jgi:hypothetical protein
MVSDTGWKKVFFFLLSKTPERRTFLVWWEGNDI